MESSDNQIDPSQTRAVRNRLIEGYLAQLPTTLIGIGVMLALNVWYYSDRVPGAVMTLWLVFMLVGLLGYGVIVGLYRVNPARCLTQRCVYWMAGMSMLLGFGWGGLASYAIQELSITDSYFGVIVGTGVVGAATATNSALPLTFKALALSSLGPLIATMFLSEHSSHHITGLACLVYLVVMIRAIDLIHGTLRRSIELGLTNADLIVSLEQQSNTDALTGLVNRRGLNRGFESFWNAGLAEQRAIGLVLCDVDYFKLYNDSLGHQAGDECLEQIGSALNTVLRSKADLVARYGGEEFAVLIADSTPEILESLCERVRLLIQELRIAHPDSTVSEFITISVGASQLQPCAGRRVEELLNTADHALYSAKANGRNCVQVIVPELDRASPDRELFSRSHTALSDAL